MTSNPYCRVDPGLPDVADADVHCPHCRQSLETICEDQGRLPERHYVKPTVVKTSWGQMATIGTEGDRGHPNLCPMTRDDLTTVIYRAQRTAAGLGPPRLFTEPATTVRSVA